MVKLNHHNKIYWRKFCNYSGDSNERRGYIYGNVILEKELSSIFFGLLSDKDKNYFCAVCELNLYCFHCHQMLWEIGFRDIVCEFKIIDNRIKIACDDGNEYLFELSTGQIKN